jgi:hypothetical protein
LCNDDGLHEPYQSYLDAFSQTRMPVKWPDAIPNLQPRDDIWPTDKAPVIRRLEDGTNEFSETPMGFPAGAAKAPARDQFPFRGTAVPGWSIPRARVVLLRVHRDEFAEVEMEVHKGWRTMVLLRRAVASDARGRHGIHVADDRSKCGCCANPMTGRWLSWNEQIGQLGSSRRGMKPNCCVHCPRVR